MIMKIQFQNNQQNQTRAIFLIMRIFSRQSKFQPIRSLAQNFTLGSTLSVRLSLHLLAAKLFKPDFQNNIQGICFLKRECWQRERTGSWLGLIEFYILIIQTFVNSNKIFSHLCVRIDGCLL